MRPDRGRIMLGMCVALFFTLSIAIAPDAQASAGDLDPSFAKDGWLELAFSQEAEATALAIQDDGKILVSIGSRWSDLFGVARFLPDGTPDLSFGGQGYVLTDVAGKSSGEDLLLQPDGAIVIAGTSGKRMVVARYLADGTPDPSFDGDGRVSIRFGDRRTSLSAAAFDADGGIVLVGTSSRTMRRSKIAVVRLMASGEIDTSFSDDGKRLVVFGSCRCAGADDVVVAPDGRITVVGWAGTTALIVALDAGGGLDTTFSGDGIVRTRFLTAARWADATAVTLTSTGLILVAGVVPGGWAPGGRLARYLPNGHRDPTFGGDGVRRFGSAIPDALAEQADGKILVGGAQCCGGGSELFFALWRFRPNGLHDRAFGKDGLVWAGYELSDNGWAAVALQPDGRIVVSGGRESGGLVVARYLA